MWSAKIAYKATVVYSLTAFPGKKKGGVNDLLGCVARVCTNGDDIRDVYSRITRRARADGLFGIRIRVECRQRHIIFH